jgi:hypothetical protein
MVSTIAGSRRLGFKISHWLGAKSASLGEMYRELPSKDVRVLNRFAIDRPSSMLGSRKFLKISIRTISPNLRQLR